MKPALFFLLFSAFLVKADFLLEESDDELDEFDHEFYEDIERRRPNVTEGDIIIENGKSPFSNNAMKNQSLMWPKGKVAIKFSPSFTNSEKSLLRGAIGEMHEKTCVRFHFKNPDDADFIVFGKPPDTKRCSSMVGRQGGSQPLYVGGECLTRRTILHEILHALGFIHEHTRSDRDEYVTIKFDNIWSYFLEDFKKQDVALLDEQIMKMGYAYESIMHYTAFQGAKNPKLPTIVPKNKFARLGGGDGLSDIDVERINLRYGCPGRTTHVKATDPPIDPQPATPRPTQPPKPTTTKAPTTQAPPKLEWKTVNGITWSNFCTFEPADTHNTTTKEQCGSFCKDYGNCDHFSWVSTVGNIGQCHIMAKYRATMRPKLTHLNTACGIIPDKVNTATAPPPTRKPVTTPEPPKPKINWNKGNGVTWSNHCSFKTWDTFAITTKYDCGPHCKGYGNCDHFTWVGGKNENTGRCNMMADYNFDIKATLSFNENQLFACGIIPEKVNRATDPPAPPPPPKINPGKYGLDGNWNCQQNGHTVNCRSITRQNGMTTNSQCQFTENHGAWSKSCSSSSTSN